MNKHEPGPSTAKSKTRTQTTVACDACRNRKTKCNGSRPSCQQCCTRGLACIYAAEPDAPPIVALKRKHEALKRQSLGEHEVISRLKSVSDRDAQRMLGLLRAGEDIDAVLQLAQGLKDLPDHDLHRNPARGSRKLQDLADSARVTSAGPSCGSVANNTISSSGSNVGADGSASALPSFRTLLASIESDPDATPKNRSLTTTPSSVQHSYVSRPHGSIPQWQHDARLSHVRALDWDVWYCDDTVFRNIICSYLTWDHTWMRLFDEDDFLDGLLGQSTESCSKTLVHSVLAFGAMNYNLLDPDTARMVCHTAMAETRRLLDEESHLGTDIATAVAGCLFYSTLGCQGLDKTGLSYLLRARHTALNTGLYQTGLVSHVYDSAHPQRTRARIKFAWGFFCYLCFLEFSFRETLALPYPPPVNYPLLSQDPQISTWIAWPWPVIRPVDSAAVSDAKILRGQWALFPILNEICPLHQRYQGGGISRARLEASFSIFERLRARWETMDPVLYDMRHATPQLLALHCMYNYAIVELFRPFTMTPETPCAHAAPLLAASLPTKPALPAISAAIARLCEVLGQFTRDYPNMQIPTLFSQFSLGVAFALLPSVSISSPFFLPSASQNLIMILRLLQRAWKLVPVIKYGALSIKQAASQMCTSIPYEAEAIFASLELEIALDKAKDKMSAAWVVDPSTSDVGYQGGRVDDLIKDLNGLNI